MCAAACCPILSPAAKLCCCIGRAKGRLGQIGGCNAATEPTESILQSRPAPRRGVLLGVKSACSSTRAVHFATYNSCLRALLVHVSFAVADAIDPCVTVGITAKASACISKGAQLIPQACLVCGSLCPATGLTAWLCCQSWVYSRASRTYIEALICRIVPLPRS